MILQEIQYNGIKELYSHFLDVTSDEKYSNWKLLELSPRNKDLLKTVTVIMHIEDLSAFEVFAIRSLLPKENVFILNSMIIEDIGSQPKELVEKRISLYEQIESDTDVENDMITALQFPYIERFSCKIFLTGELLLLITESTSTINIFKKWLGNTIYKIEQAEDGSLGDMQFKLPHPSKIFGEDSILEIKFDDFIANEFYRYFYRYYLKLFQTTDITTDSYIYYKYFNSLNYEDCLWLNIISPVTFIDMFDDTELVKNLSTMKEWYDDTYLAGEHRNEMVQLVFSCKFSLITFLTIHRYFPNIMCYWNDLKILFNNDNIHIVSLNGYDRYKVRIGQYLELLDDTISKYLKTNFIESTNYVSYATPISFVMRGSIKDFQDLNTWMLNLVESDKNSDKYLLIREIKMLQSKISNFIQILFNSLK